MFESPWEVVFVLGTAILYVLLLAQFVRSRRGPAGQTSPTEPNAVDGSQVVCADCASKNEGGYRYCCSCVAELPQSVGHGRGGDQLLHRETR